MLEIENLSVTYGRVSALRDVTLRVEQGEVVALVGPNGAGKTTTLAAVGGLITQSAGTIRFDGQSLAGLAPEVVVRRGISLVPEGRRIFGALTVQENLQLGMTIRKDRSAAYADLDRELARFPILRTYLKTPAGRLSGGEQQQLAVARALLSKPRLLLLDEPSLGLAPLVIDQVFEALADLRSDGVTTLLVEQNAARAMAFADRSYVLRTGRITASGDRETMSASTNLADLYLGL